MGYLDDIAASQTEVIVDVGHQEDDLVVTLGGVMRSDDEHRADDGTLLDKAYMVGRYGQIWVSERQFRPGWLETCDLDSEFCLRVNTGSSSFVLRNPDRPYKEGWWDGTELATRERGLR